MGSRLHNCRKGSDIDLLIDAPENSIQDIKTALNKLRILNLFDIHRYRAIYAAVNEEKNYKIIYRAKDFN